MRLETIIELGALASKPTPKGMRRPPRMNYAGQKQALTKRTTQNNIGHRADIEFTSKQFE